MGTLGGWLPDSLLRSAQSVQLIRPSRSSLLLKLVTIVRLSARMAALRDNVVQCRPFLSVAFPVLSGQWQQLGTLLQHGVTKVQEHGMGYTGGDDGHDMVG